MVEVKQISPKAIFDLFYTWKKNLHLLYEKRCAHVCFPPFYLRITPPSTITTPGWGKEEWASEWVTPFLQNLFSSSFLPRAFFRFLAPLQFCSLYCWRGKKTCPSFSSPGLIYGFLQNQGVVVACLYPSMFHDISTCRKNFFHVSSLGFPMRGGIKHVRWTDRKRFCLQILYSR